MIINFTHRAIELSAIACVSPEMRIAAFALVLASFIGGAAELPLLPTAEGTTWNYDLVQEKPIEDFDLTEPNEQEHIAVNYRLGGIEKIDNKDLQRLEIYRGDTLESVDFIAVEEHGNTCPAGVSSEPNGEFKADFKADTPAIYARWRGQGLPDHAKIRAAFIAENVADVSADSELDESSAIAPTANAKGTFTLEKPEEGWAPGSYRVEFLVDD